MIENYITTVEEAMPEAWDRFYAVQVEDGRDETMTSIATAKALIFFISQDLSELIAAEGKKKETVLSIAAALHENFIDQMAEQWNDIAMSEDPRPLAPVIYAATATAIPAGLRVVDQMLEAPAADEGDQNESD